ncbi:hypothetical protein AVEN_163613-1 [Araneus ventricosus]|uniref:Uncharacterized protein n=1 Tax=Araneus ventricosus TaxID=182803 RepID=A0A4Y2LXG0_ARAVE|nr:hypothetical protein AVEN_163613-1 [Araneus ventricosus]
MCQVFFFSEFSRNPNFPESKQRSAGNSDSEVSFVVALSHGRFRCVSAKGLHLLNPLIPKTIEIKGPQNTGTSSSSIRDKGNSLSTSKTTMTADILRIVRKFHSSPSTSERSTLTKKARAAGVK